MKKCLRMAMALVLALSLIACGSATGTPSSPAPSIAPLESEPVPSPVPSGTKATASNVLVAYFSWSGNTAEIAAYIAEQTGGDLLEIQPATPYPTDYNACGDVALSERDQDARPAIANLPASIDAYDTILIGNPKMQYGFLSV